MRKSAQEDLRRSTRRHCEIWPRCVKNLGWPTPRKMSPLVTKSRKKLFLFICDAGLLTRHRRAEFGWAYLISTSCCGVRFFESVCTGEKVKMTHNAVVFVTGLLQAQQLQCIPIMPGARHPKVISGGLMGPCFAIRWPAWHHRTRLGQDGAGAG